ncbi:unnamed protein product [Pleuronectes platessa]|uniref:Uncharacterized protein n=1 Tax=Pleuronectes platessa TaxID=8262 RepID=A0A9N7YC00_PLEPL|nr:unnamed protein product [Pleuronectes platessa]
MKPSLSGDGGLRRSLDTHCGPSSRSRGRTLAERSERCDGGGAQIHLKEIMTSSNTGTNVERRTGMTHGSHTAPPSGGESPLQNNSQQVASFSWCVMVPGTLLQAAQRGDTRLLLSAECRHRASRSRGEGGREIHTDRLLLLLRWGWLVQLQETQPGLGLAAARRTCPYGRDGGRASGWMDGMDGGGERDAEGGFLAPW